MNAPSESTKVTLVVWGILACCMLLVLVYEINVLSRKYKRSQSKLENLKRYTTDVIENFQERGRGDYLSPSPYGLDFNLDPLKSEGEGEGEGEGENLADMLDVDGTIEITGDIDFGGWGPQNDVEIKGESDGYGNITFNGAGEIDGYGNITFNDAGDLGVTGTLNINKGTHNIEYRDNVGLLFVVDIDGKITYISPKFVEKVQKYLDEVSITNEGEPL